MSYILNALKKAENKSFDGENLKVKKQILVLKRQTRGGKLKISLLISGLLGTLLLGGWLGYMQTDQTETATKTPTALPNDTVVALDHQPDSAPIRLTPPAKVADEVRIMESSQNSTNSTSSSGIAGHSAKVNPPIPVRAMPTTTNAPPADVSQPAPAPALEEDIEQNPQSYADIPMRIKQTFPSLKTTLHFYNSIPEKRLVRINGKNLHEGDWIEDGLFVEEIKPAATVLNHAGFLFSLEAPGG